MKQLQGVNCDSRETVERWLYVVYVKFDEGRGEGRKGFYEDRDARCVSVDIRGLW